MHLEQALAIIASKRTHPHGADFAFATRLATRQHLPATHSTHTLSPLLQAVAHLRSLSDPQTVDLAFAVFRRLSDANCSTSEAKRIVRLHAWLCRENPGGWCKGMSAVIGISAAALVDDKRAAVTCMEMLVQLLLRDESSPHALLLCCLKHIVSTLAQQCNPNGNPKDNPNPTRMQVTAFNALMVVVEKACVAVCAEKAGDDLREALEGQVPVVLRCLGEYGRWQSVLGRGFMATSVAALTEDLELMRAQEQLQLCVITLFTCADALRDSADCFASEAAAVEEIRKSLKEVHGAIAGLYGSSGHIETAGEAAGEAEKRVLVTLTYLRRLSLVCGMLLGLSDVGEATKFARSAVVEVGSLALRVKEKSVQRIASRFVRASLNTDDRLDGCLDLVNSLQPLLDEEDGIAAAAAEILAEAALVCPDKVLPDVFGRLSSSNAARRSNAIAVLHALLRSHTNLPENIQDQVVDGLLQRLGDARLDLRKETVQALTLYPKALPRICAILTSARRGDAAVRQRSAAADCLRHCLHQCTFEALQCALDCLVAEGEAAALIRKCVVQCLQTAKEGLRKDVFARIVDRFYLDNQSPALVGLLRQSAPVAVEGGLAQWVIEEKVMPKIAEQDGNSEEQLFERMSTLLVLKVMGERGLEQVPPLLVQKLVYRALHNAEPKAVKQVACEVLGQLDFDAFVWPLVTQILECFHRGESVRLAKILSKDSDQAKSTLASTQFKSTVDTAKAGVYICCSAVARPSFAAKGILPIRVFQTLLTTLSVDRPDGGLQQGCVQCFSLLVVQSRQHWRRTHGIVEVSAVDTEEQAEIEEVLYVKLGCIVDTIIAAAQAGQVSDIKLNGRARVSLLNAATMAFRKMPPEALVELLRTNAHVVPRLIEPIADDPIVHAAALQAAFSVWFKAEEFGRREGLGVMGGEEDVSHVHRVCLDVVKRGGNAVVRAAAVKLLGLVLSIPQYSFPQVSLAETLAALQSVANIDQDKECRQLAQNILQHATLS